jgi:hypothetical protein
VEVEKATIQQQQLFESIETANGNNHYQTMYHQQTTAHRTRHHTTNVKQRPPAVQRPTKLETTPQLDNASSKNNSLDTELDTTP